MPGLNTRSPPGQTPGPPGVGGRGLRTLLAPQTACAPQAPRHKAYPDCSRRPGQYTASSASAGGQSRTGLSCEAVAHLGSKQSKAPGLLRSGDRERSTAPLQPEGGCGRAAASPGPGGIAAPRRLDAPKSCPGWVWPGGGREGGQRPRRDSPTRRSTWQRAAVWSVQASGTPSSWALTLLNGREAPCQAAPSRQPGHWLQGTARGLDGGLQRQQDPQEPSPEGVTPTHRQSRSLRTPRHRSGRPRVRRSQTSAG